MRSEIELLQQRIGYTFKDPKLLREALIHSSYANECRKFGRRSNERLEFLGDSVLSLIVSRHLFCEKRNFPEGRLTKTRAAIVCEATLKDIAKDIGLGDCMYLGKGESAAGGRLRASILADAMEALIAAIYLDGGMEAASDFVLGKMGRVIEESCSGMTLKDYKTRLQEILQRESQQPISYEMISESGPAHDRTFEMKALWGEKVIGKGVGKSKKEAEQRAAKNAMESMKDE